MKRIFNNDGSIDFSDEGSQARQIWGDFDANLFINSLPDAQKWACEALMGQETINTIASGLGVSTRQIFRLKVKIRSQWIKWRE